MKAAGLHKLIEAVIKNKERVVLYVVFLAFFVFVGGGFFLQHTRQQGIEPAKEARPKAVELKVQKSAGGAEHGSGGEGHGNDGAESAPFFLEPSPGELLQQLTSLENLNEGVIEGKYMGLRVLWPAYFFALEDGQAGKATMVLDVDENGFGVIIQSQIDLAANPRVKTLEVGEKLWIGGEIEMVDRTGTGTVVLKAESFFFDGDPLFSQPTPGK